MSTTGTVLNDPAHNVDPRCRRWWTAQIALWVVCVLFVPALLGALIAPARGPLLGGAGAVLLVGVVLGIWLPRYLFRTHRWDVTDIGIYARRGWIWQEWRAAPFARLQTVDVTTGPLQRLFGIATVRATTASASGPVLIEAIDAAEAAELAQRLSELAQADTSEDGT